LSYLSLQGGGGGGAGGSFASASVLTRLDTPLVVRNSGLLANVELQRMCKLSDECAAQILAPPTAVVKRAFFPTVEDSYVYCGYPGGYREAAKVPSLEDRFVLRRNETWETNWEDLRHLPLPGACMDSVRNLEFEPQGGPGTPATVEEDKLTVEGAKQGTLDLTVPLLELRDVFFGGQYLPFTKHYAYVPLATAEEFGGFTQGLYPANRHKFTERGPIADYPPEQCCFKYVNWATDERGELNRELEAIQWMDSENLAAAPVIVLEGPTLVAHGGGWGDYQGGGGDNYFHMLQTLASVSFLLPQLKSDPDARLLIRICKDPWAKLKKKFFDKTYKHKVEVLEGKEVKSFFECGVEQYALELLEILGIPLQQVVHYPYDEHDPTFSSLSYRFDSRNYQKFGPVVKVSKALIQPPHVQHDAQLAELRDLFKASPLLAHLPFAKHAIVVVNRNDLFKVKVCKRCVPDMDEFVVQLKSEFEPLGFAVVEVFGTEPYAEQVKAFRSAAAVLAPHGAALTSMLHCPRGAAVFEFMHASNVNRMWFMIMAAKLGLNYWNVMSHEPARITRAKHNIPAYHTSTSAGVNSAYSNIDVDELVRALRAALLHEEVPGTVNAPPPPG